MSLLFSPFTLRGVTSSICATVTLKKKANTAPERDTWPPSYGWWLGLRDRIGVAEQEHGS